MEVHKSMGGEKIPAAYCMQETVTSRISRSNEKNHFKQLWVILNNWKSEVNSEAETHFKNKIVLAS